MKDLPTAKKVVIVLRNGVVREYQNVSWEDDGWCYRFFGENGVVTVCKKAIDVFEIYKNEVKK